MNQSISQGKEPTIVVAMPTGGSITTGTVKSLLQLQDDLIRRNIKYYFSFSQSSYLPHGRAQVCGASLERGVRQTPFDSREITHILMIDSDIIFHPNDFWKLFNWNVSVVSGAYCYSTEATQSEDNKRIVAGTWDVPFFKQHYAFPTYTLGQAKNSANPLLEVDWVGMGFLLVKAEVFYNIDYPWFVSETIKIDNYQDTTSEDVGWCRKVKAAGYPILLDPSVKVGHQKVTVV